MPPVLSPVLEFGLPYSITVGEAKQIAAKLFLSAVYVHSMLTNLD
jgi:hypothetical protein